MVQRESDRLTSNTTVGIRPASRSRSIDLQWCSVVLSSSGTGRTLRDSFIIVDQSSRMFSSSIVQSYLKKTNQTLQKKDMISKRKKSGTLWAREPFATHPTMLDQPTYHHRVWPTPTHQSSHIHSIVLFDKKRTNLMFDVAQRHVTTTHDLQLGTTWQLK